MNNKEWTALIVKEFNVSNTVAKEMYHKMLQVYKIKKEIKKVLDK